MKFNEKFKVEPGFESLFRFPSKEEELAHEARMMMFRFLSELEKLNDGKPVRKKDMAKAIGTSPSFITQLFQGDKLISLLTLAKLQDAYDFTYQIEAAPNKGNYKSEVEQAYNTAIPIRKNLMGNKGYWVYKNPGYNKTRSTTFKPKGKLKVA
jgi:transcriptional regulator with XRE-family HTH domain